MEDARIRRLVRPWGYGAGLTEDVRAELDSLGIRDGEEYAIVHPELLRELLAGVDAKAMPRFARKSDTSRKAALMAYPSSGCKRERVLLAIARLPRTREQLARDLHMPDKTVGPRVKELIDGGWVQESSITRPTATLCSAHVVELTEKGWAAVRGKARELSEAA